MGKSQTSRNHSNSFYLNLVLELLRTAPVWKEFLPQRTIFFMGHVCSMDYSGYHCWQHGVVLQGPTFRARGVWSIQAQLLLPLSIYLFSAPPARGVQRFPAGTVLVLFSRDSKYPHLSLHVIFQGPAEVWSPPGNLAQLSSLYWLWPVSYRTTQWSAQQWAPWGLGPRGLQPFLHLL